VVRDWRERARAFTAIGAFVPGNVNLRSADDALRVSATFAEPEVFQALGVSPLYGRLLLPGDTARGPERVVVLSHALWRDRFGGSKAILGQTIRIDASDHMIVGVMPAGFELPPRSDGRRPGIPPGELADHACEPAARVIPGRCKAARLL
jgi:putative ABC transport system permease protein